MKTVLLFFILAIVSFISLYMLMKKMNAWISLKFHVFTYTGWKLYLSFFTYVLVFAANIWLSNFIEKKHPYKGAY